MGKGDKKSRTGKIALGSFGTSRKKRTIKKAKAIASVKKAK